VGLPHRAAGGKVDTGSPAGREGRRAEPALTGLPHGPLAGPGAGPRLAPFAAVGLLGALSAAAGRPGALVAVAAALVVVAGALWLPWRRWPVGAQAAVPLAGCAVFVALSYAQDGAAADVLPMVFLPVVWLALYHSRALLWLGLFGLAVGLAVVDAAHGPARSLELLRPGLLAVVVAGLVGVTLNTLVGGARRAGAELSDAAERAAAERDLAARTLHAAGALMCVLDRRGRIVLFNRRVEEALGHRAGAVLGRPYWRVGLRPEHPAELDGLVRALTTAGEPLSYEDDWFTATGQRRRLVWTVSTLRDWRGAVTQYVATGQDVTAQRETERLFRYVRSAGTEYAVFAVDVQGTFTVFNAGAEKLFGHRAEDVVGQRDIALLYRPGQLADRIAALGVDHPVAAVMHPVRPGVPHTEEATLVRRDGTDVPVALTLNAIQDERDRLLGYLGTARDITVERQAAAATTEALRRERQATTRLRDLNEAQNTFVTTVSHELRTPLTSIMAYTEMLLDDDAGPVTAAQRNVLGAVDRNARRLHALVTDLLLVSELESGGIDAERLPVDLRHVVAGALDALDPARSAPAVTVTVDQPHRPVGVVGDQAALERAAVNVIGNALKFTPPGGEVTVTLAVVEAAATLVVRDTGVGIPAADLPHVVDRFFRSSTSKRSETPGTGLGLSIAHTIVQQHNGTLTIESAPGLGTTVTMVFLAAMDPAATPPAAAVEASGRS
jgi:PAS domain S-box-containing protein